MYSNSFTDALPTIEVRTKQLPEHKPKFRRLSEEEVKLLEDRVKALEEQLAGQKKLYEEELEKNNLLLEKMDLLMVRDLEKKLRVAVEEKEEFEKKYRGQKNLNEELQAANQQYLRDSINSKQRKYYADARAKKAAGKKPTREQEKEIIR